MPLYEVKGQDVIDNPAAPDGTDLTVSGINSTHIVVKSHYDLGRILWARPRTPPPAWSIADWHTIEKGKTVTIFLGPVPVGPPAGHTVYFRKLKYQREIDGEDVTATISVEEKNIT